MALCLPICFSLIHSPDQAERGDPAVPQLPGGGRERGEEEGEGAGLSAHCGGGAAVGQEGGSVAHGERGPTQAHGRRHEESQTAGPGET